jgi:uncharacterized protein
VRWIVTLLVSALVIPFAAPGAAAVVNRGSLPPASAKAKQDNRIGQKAYDDEDWVEALPALSSACDAYVPDACSTLGSLYLNGLGVEKDEARAVLLFEQSCNEGSNSGCGRAGAVMLYGFAGRAVNPEVGIPMSEKSCAGGFGIACNNLGRVYFQGKLVPTNQPLALRYFERACILQERGGCSNAGDVYLDGKGAVADSAKAFSFYSKACSLREGSACMQMGSMLYYGNGIRTDKGLAANAFVAACNLNNAQGCTLAAQRFDKGDGVAQDQSRATLLFAKACQGRDAEGCHWMGWRSLKGVGGAADPSVAQRYFAQACTLGRSEACPKSEGSKPPNNAQSSTASQQSDLVAQGNKFAKGEGVAKDLAYASKLFEQACSAGRAAGCYNLAVINQTGGVGFRTSRIVAREWYRRACVMNFSDSCSRFDVINNYIEKTTNTVLEMAALSRSTRIEAVGLRGCNVLKDSDIEDFNRSIKDLTSILPLTLINEDGSDQQIRMIIQQAVLGHEKLDSKVQLIKHMPCRK